MNKFVYMLTVNSFKSLSFLIETFIYENKKGIKNAPNQAINGVSISKSDSLLLLPPYMIKITPKNKKNTKNISIILSFSPVIKYDKMIVTIGVQF